MTPELIAHLTDAQREAWERSSRIVAIPFVARFQRDCAEALRSLAELRVAVAEAPHDRNPEDPCSSEQTAWESHMSDTQGVTRDTGRPCDCWKSRVK